MSMPVAKAATGEVKRHWQWIVLAKRTDISRTIPAVDGAFNDYALPAVLSGSTGAKSEKF